MLHFIFKILKFFLFSITLFLLSHLPAHANNKIVAVVNNEVVTQRQLNEIMYALKQQNQGDEHSIGSEQQLRKKALDQLIGNKLMLQIAKQYGIEATETEVNQQIQTIVSHNNLSLEKFKEVLARDGSSYQAYQEFVKNQITLNKLHAQVLGPKIKLTEKDIQAEITQAKKMDGSTPIQILDVLVTPASSKEAEPAMQAALKIKQQLKQGQELQASIKAAQTHPKIKISAQDLGWKSLSELPDLFANAVKNLPAGQVADPVEAPNGIHLLVVVNRKGGTTLTHQDAQKMAIHKKMQGEIENWVKELKKQAYIEIK